MVKIANTFNVTCHLFKPILINKSLTMTHVSPSLKGFKIMVIIVVIIIIIFYYNLLLGTRVVFFTTQSTKSESNIIPVHQVTFFFFFGQLTIFILDCVCKGQRSLKIHVIHKYEFIPPCVFSHTFQDSLLSRVAIQAPHRSP